MSKAKVVTEGSWVGGMVVGGSKDKKWSDREELRNIRTMDLHDLCETILTLLNRTAWKETPAICGREPDIKEFAAKLLDRLQFTYDKTDPSVSMESEDYDDYYREESKQSPLVYAALKKRHSLRVAEWHAAKLRGEVI